jgi:glycosyltransferase involved in cell wall biosynthesis
VTDGPLTLLDLHAADASILNPQHVTSREILTRLPPERYRVRVYARGETWPRWRTATHVEVRPLPRKRQSLRLLWDSLRHPPDVLFQPNPDKYDAFVEKPLLRFRKRVRLVVHLVLSVDPRRLGPETMGHLRRQVERADLLTANGPAVVRTTRDAFGREPVLMLEGVALDAFRARDPGASRRARPVVAAVGSFQPRKRYDLFLEAAAARPDADFWCVGAGPGPQRAWVESEIARRGLRNVRIDEPMSPADLGRRLAESDVLFHPSEHEGAPQVVLQAQATGCVPVVRASTLCPTVEPSADGESADDDAGLLRALGALLDDRARLERLSRAAVESARRLSWDVVAKRWDDLLWSTFRGAAS